MLRDGNFCVYLGEPSNFRFGTYQSGKYSLETRDDWGLIMQDDGNLCVKTLKGHGDFKWGSV